MRQLALVMLVLIVVALFALPASAGQDVKTTVDDIAVVQFVARVYWADKLVWQYQIFGGPGVSTPVVKLPEGCTIKFRLEAVGTDGNKPIFLSLDKGEGTVPTEAQRELCYPVGVNDDMIIVRTLYKDAVRHDAPYVTFIVAWGGHKSFADRKGVYAFAVESTKVYDIKCAADAKEAIVRLGCVGHEPTMSLNGASAGLETEFGPATIPNMIPLEIVDPAAYARFVAEQKVLDANQDQGIQASIALGNQNARAIAELQAEQERNRRAHGTPAVKSSAPTTTQPTTQTAPAQLSLKERLLRDYANGTSAVFGNVRTSGTYKYWFRASDQRWYTSDGRFVVTPIEEAVWSSKGEYAKMGYVEFGVTQASASVPPSRTFPLDPNLLQIIILDEEAK